MANSVSNTFSDVRASCALDAKATSVPERSYSEQTTREGGRISILYLSSDSGVRIRRTVENKSKDHVRGAISNYKKNVEEMPGTTSDDHLKDSIVKSYKAGGEMALSVMLGLAEEEHAIQSACDTCELACLGKYANVRFSEVSKRIAESKPDVFHFSGHLVKDKGLAFCRAVTVGSSKAESDYMDESSLISCFKRQKVELAVIASCNSAPYAKALVESSVAKMAIGSTNSVEDLETIMFVQKFYSELTKLVATKGLKLSTAIQKAFSAAEKSVRAAKCHMRIYPEAAKVLTPDELRDNLFNFGSNELSASGRVRSVYLSPHDGRAGTPRGNLSSRT